MSEESLKQLLERMSSDEAFRERLKNDWPEASAEYDLSEAELVRGAVAGLSARDAAAVRLVTDFGFSPEDLGPALGVTPGAARVVLHRARRRLRDALVAELLVRRQLDGCAELAPLHDQGDAIAAARHVRQCPACQDAARSEVVGYDLRVQAGHPDPRLA